MTIDELKTDIDELKTEMDQRFDSLQSEMRRGFEALATLISQHSARSDERFDKVTERADAQQARLDRHAALWQTGRRWSGRMGQWAEKVDKSLDTQARNITELLVRIQKLESK